MKLRLKTWSIDYEIAEEGGIVHVKRYSQEDDSSLEVESI